MINIYRFTSDTLLDISSVYYITNIYFRSLHNYICFDLDSKAKFAPYSLRNKFGFFYFRLIFIPFQADSVGCRGPPLSIVFDHPKQKTIETEENSMATEPKRVFIKHENTYLEITYQQLSEIQAADFAYRKKHHFVLIQGILVEVSEQTKKELKSDADRMRYIQNLDKELGLLSIDAFDSDDDNGTDYIADPDEDVVEFVSNKLMVDKLHLCIEKLSSEEQRLINEYFFMMLSEKQLSKKYGITQQAVSKRIKKILAKLKNFLNN